MCNILLVYAFIFTNTMKSCHVSDIELRNIIDKLAQFVARNGPEFEEMTKNKQKDNPKFSFLFGGEYYNYYKYKVSSEQGCKYIFVHFCNCSI